jgi:hypothetical protein
MRAVVGSDSGADRVALSPAEQQAGQSSSRLRATPRASMRVKSQKATLQHSSSSGGQKAAFNPFKPRKVAGKKPHRCSRGDHQALWELLGS